MANLSDEERFGVWARWMRENADTVTITKGELRAAVNAVDAFMSDNAAAMNAAIPQPARSALSLAQKAHLLTFVIERRYLTGA